MLEPLELLFAFFAGFIFKRLNYPPLLGYLIVGFISSAFGIGDLEVLEQVGEFGVNLMLFVIGLKLRVKELKPPQVWGAAIIQMLLWVGVIFLVLIALNPFLDVLAFENNHSAFNLAFAFSFSSTVLAIKIFDDRGASNTSLYVSVTIGILIIQDIIAVVYLVLSKGQMPSVWAFCLLLLPLLRPLLIRILNKVGYDELLIFYGISVAVIGAEIFDFFYLKGELGALVFGMLMGNTEKSDELYKRMSKLKDLFLIGFFLSIGHYGLPNIEIISVALILCGVLLIRPILYFFMFVAFKLRARSSVLSSLGLFNYSEFGLIVAALAVSVELIPQEWMTVIALALTFSFFISIPINVRAISYLDLYNDKIIRFQRKSLILQESDVELGNARFVIFGMGRIGPSIYEYMEEFYEGVSIGIENNVKRVEELNNEGVKCVFGDVTDGEFLRRANLIDRELIFVSLTTHKENIAVVKLLQKNNFKGTISVICRFEEEQKELESMGCITFNLYTEVGHGFAEDTLEKLGI
ncbi:cation:proton antiporter family protein [Sediminitomix flava]|uniref:Transporter (CPA2 family) n=1 Tax=Sediminitomix flava TaxID=379075 RepID=A0A315Z6Z0_SEDFL|nr:cation:proton antiporter family protein [Sediminitomix flava]PWJ40177.1 transporter (CPA2 family) [Sediminitomix flava]